MLPQGSHRKGPPPGARMGAQGLGGEGRSPSLTIEGGGFYLGRWQNQGQSVKEDQFGGFSSLHTTLGPAIISRLHIDYIPLIFSQPSDFRARDVSLNN